MSEQAVVTKVRTQPVDGIVFGRIYSRVAKAGGSVQNVIDAVFEETGVKMTEQNVGVKASNLRRDGANIGNLKRKGRSKLDIASLNAELEAEAKAAEADEAEKSAETTETTETTAS